MDDSVTDVAKHRGRPSSSLEPLSHAEPDEQEAFRRVRDRLAADDLLREVGRYTIVGRLGEGGMGVVYRAFDPTLDRSVAVKVVRGRDRGVRAQGHERLVREGRALAQLAHPNVVAIYDIGVVKGDVFIAMELVEGSTLRQWIGAAHRSAADTCAVLADAARGLSAAHREGLVHRDFKPSNVLIGDDGRVRVADFGLVTEIVPQSTDVVTTAVTDSAPSARLTCTGSVVGTPRYMAPEQHAGAQGDARSDQFAFCAAALECLTGHPVYAGADLEALAAAKRRGPPRRAPDGVSRRLWRTLRRGLEPNPADRWPDMDRIVAVLSAPRGHAVRRTALGAVAGVVLVGVVVGASSPSAHPCERLRGALQEHWNAERVAGLEERFHATGAPHAAETWARVRTRADDFVREWDAGVREVCPSARPQWNESAREHAWCLRRSAARFAVLLEALEGVDAELLTGAVVATEGGTNFLRGCFDHAPEGAAPGAPIPSALQQAIDRLEVLRDAGAMEEGLRQAEHALALARTVEASGVVGRVAYVAAQVHRNAGKLTEAAALSEEAHLSGSRIGDERLALDAAFLRALIAADGQAIDVARRWQRHAESRYRRGDFGIEVEAALAGLQGMIASAAGSFDEAAEAFRREIELREAGSRRTTALHDLAGVEIRRGRLAEAAEIQQEVIELFTRQLGRAHPDTLAAKMNLAIAFAELGRHAEAMPLYEEVLALVADDAALHRANLLTNLGIALVYDGRADEGLARLRAAEAVYREMDPVSHQLLASNLANQGLAHEANGDHERALAAHVSAREIVRSMLPRDHPFGPTMDVNIAIELRALGRTNDALTELEQAVPRLQNAYSQEHPYVLEAQVELAEVLTEVGRRAEAVAVLERALPHVEGPLAERVEAGLLKVRDAASQ